MRRSGRNEGCFPVARPIALLAERNPVVVASPAPKGSAPDDVEDTVQLRVDARLLRCGLDMRLVVPPDENRGRPPRVDESLLKAVARGHVWYERLLAGKVESLQAIAKELEVHHRYVGRIFRCAFLAPDIVEAILAGRQPSQLTVERLRLGVPLSWDEQRRVFGFGSG